MSEMDVLSLLIGDIYDAALDPTLWTPVLANAAAFVGGISATLFTKDASTKSGGIVYDDGGIDAHYKQLYFERYIKLDPATTAHYFAMIDEPMATADLVPYDEFVQSRFYLEWARPQKLVDFVTSTLDKSATSAAFFGVFRHERDGIVDEATRRRMRQIAPHIRRAVLVGRARLEDSGGGHADRNPRRYQRRHVPGRCEWPRRARQCRRPCHPAE
jgi:hypothetical protein